MKNVRKMIEIDEELCDGCGLCVPSCAEGALEIRDGKARLRAERLCDGLGACLGECPKGALKIVERSAEAFEEMVMPAHEQGCPGARLQPLGSRPASARNVLGGGAGLESELTHWPVQIRLVPPHAPFLDGADLLVAADCVPVAHPRFHSDLLAGKAVVIGCPKFDDLEEYTRGFTKLFEVANPRSVTVAVMEVPCCRSLPFAVKRGMELAGKEIPFETVVVSLRGAVLERIAS